MSIINTREIVKIIKEKQKEKFALFADAHGHRPRLCIFFVGTDSASELYVKVKKKYAEEVLVDIVEKRFENITTDALVSEVEKMKTECEGMIVQLPLPETIDKDLVLKSIPTNLDIDLLAPVLHTNCGCGECGVSKSDFVQPVAFAVKSILKSYDVSLFGKQVVVLGKGKLVGQPVLEILEDMLIRECQQSLLAGETVHIRSELAKLVSLDKSDMETDEGAFYNSIREADILITGIGSPSFVQPAMLKPGVVLIDAGTSENKGTMHGDIDLACESVASIFSASRGGVGPLTVCGLFENLATAL